MADELAELLAALRIRTTLYSIATLPRDWGVEFPATTGAYFHVISGTTGWLRPAGGVPVGVGDGDVALLARGSAHRLTGDRDAVPRLGFDPSRWRPNQVNPADDPTGAPDEPFGASLICGAVEFRGDQTLIGLLPPVFVLDAHDPAAHDAELTLRLLHSETNRGSGALLARLGDLLLVQVLRCWLARDEARGDGWLSALKDPQIGRVIAALHADPAAAWTVESMARAAALSRSRFAERFTALVGRPPLDYLTGWRLDLADSLLREGRTVREVSRTVGYGSEAAFSRAFSRRHGRPPTAAAG
jgi:AraC-like DNA-binding protein